MADMDMNSTADDCIVLHSRHCLAENGAPAMTERVLSFLNRGSAPSVARPGLGLTLDEARDRLAREYPSLSAAVERCCVGSPRRTLRAAATELGVRHRTVREWKLKGVAQLVIWCGLHEDDVIEALKEVDKS